MATITLTRAKRAQRLAIANPRSTRRGTFVLVTGDPTWGGCSGDPAFGHKPGCTKLHLNRTQRARVFSQARWIATHLIAGRKWRHEPIVVVRSPGVGGIIAWALRKQGVQPVMVSAKQVTTTPRLALVISDNPTPAGDSRTWRLASRLYQSDACIAHVRPSTDNAIHGVLRDDAESMMWHLSPADINWAKGERSTIDQLTLDIDSTVGHTQPLDDTRPVAGEYRMRLDELIAGGWIEAALPWAKASEPLPKKHGPYRQARPAPKPYVGAVFRCHHCSVHWPADEIAAAYPALDFDCPRCQRTTYYLEAA